MAEFRRNWELNFLFPTFRRAGFTRYTSTHFFMTDWAFQKPYRQIGGILEQCAQEIKFRAFDNHFVVEQQKVFVGGLALGWMVSRPSLWYELDIEPG
jgi:hypothetical protein